MNMFDSSFVVNSRYLHFMYIDYYMEKCASTPIFRVCAYETMIHKSSRSVYVKKQQYLRMY